MGLSRIVVALALVLAAGPSPAVATAPAADSSPAVAALSPPVASVNGACFPGDGYRFDIGTEGPRVVAVLHLSILTDPLNPGAFGVELSGTALDQSIVSLQAGVRYDGVDGPGQLFADPFAPFAYVFDYRMRLPMFASADVGPTEYESEKPFSGPVERAEC